ncbi:hypothetical protein BZA70DRAFT_278353 [Myxozyma melibiosi]|uniref:Phosphatidic acid phosphatase type 2/haloperoxidase domain-containing protein n=1 Tax=Myxozyma melibiosi TaxID=54550 RepID=A0ABR1F6R4_9ASCO
MWARLKYKLLPSPAPPLPTTNDPASSSFSNLANHASAASLVKPPIYRIETSFNILQTVGALRAHNWVATDIQYAFLFFIGLFSLLVAEDPPIAVKVVVSVLLFIGLLIPITSQFLLPALPVFAWLLLFTSATYIPAEWRPPITVSVLPTLESIFYGENVSEILSSRTSSLLDVLAWLPYGVMHYGGPVVCAMLVFIFGSPGTLPCFARSFGYMNLTGVLIQLMFPSAPPWYEVLHGFAPADYSMPGSPGGLARIDELFGLDIYSSAFGASPLVFGAFPSLHSGFSVLECMFLSHVFPRLSFMFIFYVLWIWWSTMYLTHHYFIDLIGGAILALTVFLIAKWNFLPSSQTGKSSRWQYEYIELTDINTAAVRNVMQKRRDSNIRDTIDNGYTYDDYDEFDDNPPLSKVDENEDDIDDDPLTPLASGGLTTLAGAHRYSATDGFNNPNASESQHFDESDLGFGDEDAGDYFNSSQQAKYQREDLYHADFDDPYADEQGDDLGAGFQKKNKSSDQSKQPLFKKGHSKRDSEGSAYF